MEQQPPVNPVQAPQSPNTIPVPGQTAEQLPPAPEQVPAPQESLAPNQGVAAVVPPQQGAPTVPQVVPVVTQADDQADENPTDANDIDVIEKEWVDRAKAIVAKTKADPYEQEKQVSELQADYMKKRYGRDIGLVEK